MTAVYNPVATALTTVTEPVDTEPRTVASVTQMTRTLADGVAFVQGRTDVVATLAALTAIAAPADGTVRHVLGQGFYVFKTSATTGLSPFRLAADDATAGGWVASTAHQTTRTVLANVAGMPLPWTCSAYAPDCLIPSGGSFFPVTTGATTMISSNGGGGAGAYVFTHNQAVNTGSAVSKPLRFAIDQYLIDGATLSTVTLSMLGASAHASLPAMMPSFGIFRVSAAGTGGNLLSGSTGLASDTTAVLATYEAAHDVTYTPNQNNVIDKASYNYFLMWFDEGHTNSVVGQVLHSFAFAHTAIPDARRS